MMWQGSAVAALALAVTGTAHAGITYDCDTAAGHFSELLLPAPAAKFHVSGNVRVNAIAADKKWAPTMRLRIGSAPASPGAPPGSFGGFDLTAVPGKTVSLAAETVQALSFDAAGHDEEVIPSSLRATGAIQPFDLSYDGKAVTVAIGADTRSYPLTTGQPVVQVICSTGEFLITDLVVEPRN